MGIQERLPAEVSLEGLKQQLVERDDPDKGRVVGRIEAAVRAQAKLAETADALAAEDDHLFSRTVDAEHAANVRKQTGMTPQELERLTTALIEGEITMEEFSRRTAQVD